MKINKRIEELEKMKKECKDCDGVIQMCVYYIAHNSELRGIKLSQEEYKKEREDVEHTHQINLDCARKGTMDKVTKVIEKRIEFLNQLIKIDKDENTVYQYYTRINELNQFKQELGIK